MDSTTSVSQGSFLFMPKGFSLGKLKKTLKRKLDETVEEPWEKSFSKIWKNVDKEVKDINDELLKKMLASLLQHMNVLYNEVMLDEGVIPCEILLTGPNLPDHNALISSLSENVKKEVTPFMSVLWSRNCGNIRNTIVNLVQQIIPICSKTSLLNESEISSDEASEDDFLCESSSKISLQMSQYTLATLCAWYSAQAKSKEKKQPLIIFFPDFESFSPLVLSDFILLLSSYSSQVPCILIFGVATTPGVVYQCLPRNVLSQLVIQVFKSEPSISFLNHVVEKIFFSEKCPFHMGENCTTFLTDLFLFHLFSVQSFVQGFKFCMMEHFYKKNHFALCCPPVEVEEQASLLSDESLESIRKLPSFQKFVEKSSKDDRKLLLLDSDYTRKAVGKMIKEIHAHFSNFHFALKCLHILTQDLPQSPLGKHLREIYCKSVSSDIRETHEYKESLKLLHLQSRSELTAKISLLVESLKLNSLSNCLSLDKNTKISDISSKLEDFKKEMDKIGNSQQNGEEVCDFETARKSLLDYLEAELIGDFLRPISTLPLYEIILFDDLPAVRRRISGSPRSSIHLALSNPQYYLDCKCCKLPHSEAVLPTLPDVSVAYKLHLEFGKVINLYDWLQAFAACVNPEMSETEMNEEIHARFTRAVSELQFMGFIKPSRTKTDYVTRLTWGNS